MVKKVTSLCDVTFRDKAMNPFSVLSFSLEMNGQRQSIQVQWATKVMTHVSMYFLWRQG